MTDDEIREAGRLLAQRSRAEQGLPEHITDAAVIRRVASIVMPGVGDAGP